MPIWIAASVLVVGLDLTVLNLALPTMAVSLHASTGDLQWISDAYSLVLAAGILPAGLLGDRYGRKKILFGAHFQEVLGANALGSGIRLLPLVGGMPVGMVAGTRLQSRRPATDGGPGRPLAGAKTVVTAGYVFMAIAMAIGACR